MSRIGVSFAALAFCALAGGALAQQAQGQGHGRGQPGMGPVAAQCNDDMVAFCPGKEHGSGAIRDCLEANKAKVSDSCRAALDATGKGRRG